MFSFPCPILTLITPSLAVAKASAKARRTHTATTIVSRYQNPARIAGRGRLEGRGFGVAETASSETDCTRDSGTDPAGDRNRAYQGVPQSGERDAVSRVTPEEATPGNPGGIRLPLGTP